MHLLGPYLSFALCHKTQHSDHNLKREVYIYIYLNSASAVAQINGDMLNVYLWLFHEGMGMGQPLQMGKTKTKKVFP